MNKKKKKMGPPIGNKNAAKAVKKSATLNQRHLETDIDSWKAKAKVAGLSMSDWVRKVLNEA